MKYNNKDQCDGYQNNNELNGNGKIYYNNNKFEGYFINRKREGKGIIKIENSILILIEFFFIPF